MKVLRIEAHNVLRLRDVSLDMSGRHLFIVGGKNDQGKSSALNAFLMAICGKKGMDYPGVPLKDGESEGWVRVKLDHGDSGTSEAEGITIERNLTRRRDGGVKDELRIIDSDGNPSPSPQAMLDSLFNTKAFDPLAFERMKPKDQEEQLRKMLGLDFSEIDAEYDRVYRSRTSVNREGEARKAATDAMPRHGDAPDKEVSVTALSEELKTREESNAKNTKLRSDAESAMMLAKRDQDELAALEQQIGEVIRQSQASAIEANRLKEISDQAVDLSTEEIHSQIVEAGSQNRKLQENIQRDQSHAALLGLRGKSKDLSDQLQILKSSKQSALESAEWPIDGLSLDSNGIVFNELPFSQAAKSVRIRTSIRMGMAMNPQLRILVCQDGNDLDNEHMDELDKILQENDFQMLVEVVTRNKEDEGRCQVILEDGAIK